MKKLTIPKYTLGEEVTNSITHGLGVFFGIVILVLTIVMSAHNHNTVGVVASCIYGTSMIIMFLISCLYHAMSPRIGAKKVFRVLDHCDIYVFIAGSYTPFCISLIGGKVGWTLFGIIWACALFGVLLKPTTSYPLLTLNDGISILQPLILELARQLTVIRSLLIAFLS